MPENPKGDGLDETVQIIEVAAHVSIDDLIMKHGILFTKKGQRTFKLYFDEDPVTKEITACRFVKIEPETPKIKSYVLRNMRKPPAIVLPKKKGLITP